MSAVRSSVVENRAPTLEGIERASELLLAEVARVMERARENERRLQDCDAEAEVFDPVRARVARDQRVIARMLTKAQCELVPPDDDRYGAARQTYGYAVEADKGDAAWVDHRAPAVEGVAA